MIMRPAKSTRRAATARPPREQNFPSIGNELASQPVPPPWGWKVPYAGRAAHIAAPAEYQATTAPACGLFPFVAGSGTPVTGTPVGRHQLLGEAACLDPLAWLRAGLVTNPGMFVLGQPGTG